MAIPPELKEIALLSIMNPGTILAGFFLGRRADQAQKIVVGAFASGIAGAGFAWLLRELGYADFQPRSLAGVFVLSFALGVLTSWIGFSTRRPA